MTLFAFDTPNARKISVALEEMELDYTVQIVDITKDEQFHPEFLAISPNNKIPAITDPDGPDARPIHIFESGAIRWFRLRRQKNIPTTRQSWLQLSRYDARQSSAPPPRLPKNCQSSPRDSGLMRSSSTPGPTTIRRENTPTV
ncbi:MAG: hypothetical protein EBY76_11165 [Betaproteobacteria bacterium]|nr:hypothetical protein [Betaproteobacteria bacterium]